MSHACWGIFRESTHSPGRESDDTEILGLTGKHLEAKGFQVKLRTADEVNEIDDDRPRFVFLMCERVDVLSRLRALEVSGVPHVNSPRAVHNTYRDRMIAVLEEANVPFIRSLLVSTAERPAPGPLPVWVKRGDVHNTQEESALQGLAERRIPRAVIQPHVSGDLVKFYGIGAGGGPHREPPWFRWFYHKDQHLAGHALDPRRLARLVRKAAAALGLEVYGGDAIATATGELVLLDVNAWPSFALYRDEASAAIASYLALRFSGGRR
ncbi:MAG: hypothetical protein DMD99_11570 [Candidatus Rokuibacteriota bacterium]|nr:MAG: hypothetical protein DMD99_11570 [Candidatus Rokubacteria bacterium]